MEPHAIQIGAVRVKASQRVGDASSTRQSLLNRQLDVVRVDHRRVPQTLNKILVQAKARPTDMATYSKSTLATQTYGGIAR